MRWTIVCILALAMVAAPTTAKHTDDNPGNDDETPCHPETPFDERCARACPRDGWGGLKCATWREAEQGYWCSLANGEEAPDTATSLLEALRDDAYPLVKQQKCEAVNGTNDDLAWWNEEVRHWRDAWWCYVLGGEMTCPEDPKASLKFWVICRSYSLVMGHDPYPDCPAWSVDEARDERPSLAPPCPPYPTGCD